MLATSPLAAATGLVVLLIAILAFGVPLLSVAALLVALGGFALVWLAAYVAHTLISPDGALFTHTVLMWRLLFIEARERRRRYGKRE
jgi:heme exporter protein D